MYAKQRSEDLAPCSDIAVIIEVARWTIPSLQRGRQTSEHRNLLDIVHSAEPRPGVSWSADSRNVQRQDFEARKTASSPTKQNHAALSRAPPKSSRYASGRQQSPSEPSYLQQYSSRIGHSVRVLCILLMFGAPIAGMHAKAEVYHLCDQSLAAISSEIPWGTAFSRSPVPFLSFCQDVACCGSRPYQILSGMG